jgi:phage terminase large subunit
VTVTLLDGTVVTKKLRFIAARLKDNPHLGREYEANLQRLPPAERAALLEGRWGVVEVPGAIYREELAEARVKGRICGVAYDKAVPVHTYWDIGIRDATAIWCAQRVGREWHLIDYYEESGKTAADHAGWLKTRGYVYGDHWLPHDAEARERGTGLTYQEVLESHGINTKITPRMGVEEGITAARTLFGQCWIDERKCAPGIRALQFYRRDWRDKTGQFTAPVHDWASNGSDAFRYFAVASGVDTSPMNLPALKYPKMGIV